MKDILKGKTFWIFSAVFAVIIFIIAINSNKAYRSEMDVLFLPKSEMAARNINQIVANAKQIPLSLSFYNKLVENNSDIEDGAMELPDAKRKQFWNAQISTEQIRKSGVVSVIAYSDNPMQADIINRQVTADLLVVMSRYYNIKTDLDMRIIDGPIADQIARTNIALWVFISLAIGLILGFIVGSLTDLILGKAEDMASEEKIDIGQKTSIFPKFSFPEVKIEKHKAEFPPKKPFNFKVEEEEALVTPKNEKAFVAAEKKATAPDNLPFAEDFEFNAPKQEEGAAKIYEEKKFSADMAREATPEEVRARLNKLLGGDMLK